MARLSAHTTPIPITLSPPPHWRRIASSAAAVHADSTCPVPARGDPATAYAAAGSTIWPLGGRTLLDPRPPRLKTGALDMSKPSNGEYALTCRCQRGPATEMPSVDSHLENMDVLPRPQPAEFGYPSPQSPTP